MMESGRARAACSVRVRVTTNTRVAGGWWLVTTGWWLVAGGYWLLATGSFAVALT